ncbi:hypothetical protein C8Q75DRAFT_887106 [Abortiporus biennis]|nr:hypothetical protein C8Q75DRAFT_887106 [Abortiporus biennis]
MSSSVKRTYSTRTLRQTIPSSPVSELTSSPPTKRKRPLIEQLSFENTPKKRHLSFPSGASSSSASAKSKSSKQSKQKQSQLTQLHFTLESSTLRACPLCDLSYTKGAPDDELLHRSHCARVQRGLEWGREEEKEFKKADVEELESGVKLSNGSKGRIISFRADVGGKIGSKLSILLNTINLSLSSPALSPSILQSSKVYLFLLPSNLSSSTSKREKIIGCVIAQRISTAMEIAPSPSSTQSSLTTSTSPSPSFNSPSSESESTSEPSLPSLIPVDPSTGLYIHPTPLPTPMGIPRLFVSTTHRRQGIATRLLTAASQNFILGCPLDPKKGQVAFSQPTGLGKKVLEAWGGGGVRIYQE